MGSNTSTCRRSRASRGRTWGLASIALIVSVGALSACSSDSDADDQGAAAASSTSSAAPSTPAAEPGGTGSAPNPSSTTAPGGESDTDPSQSPEPAAGSPTAQESENPEVDPTQTDDGEPGEPDAQGRQGDVFVRIPGVDGPGCVSVGDQRDVRSGGFVAGAFDDARAGYGTVRPGFAKRDVRLYFVPLHAARMPGVTITATGPGGARGQVVRTTPGDTDSWKFYDSTIRLSTPGAWTFRVVAGRDRGCFEATI